MNAQPSPHRGGVRKDYSHLKPQVIAALKAGMSVGATHRELGVPEATIARWRDEAGIPVKKAGAWNHPGYTT